MMDRLVYAAIISLFSPFANLYQLTRLHRKKLAILPDTYGMFRMSLDVFFVQVKRQQQEGNSYTRANISASFQPLPNVFPQIRVHPCSGQWAPDLSKNNPMLVLLSSSAAKECI